MVRDMIQATAGQASPQIATDSTQDWRSRSTIGHLAVWEVRRDSGKPLTECGKVALPAVFAAEPAG